MNAAPRIDSYEWAGGREAMLRFGPEDGPIVVLALPLFEEANRTRAVGVGVLRALAAQRIGGVLPELPGQGESETATVDMRLADLRAALAAVPGTHEIAVRSGALLVGGRRPCWLLAPQDGASLVRELARVKGGRLDADQIEVAGNQLSGALIGELGQTRFPGESRGPVAMSSEGQITSPSSRQLGPGLRRGGERVVRLASDPLPADLHVDGPPLWRRAEPDNDPVLAQTLANDIADWIAACER